MEPKTLHEAILYFAVPENCVDYLVSRRWPNGVACPTCGRTDVSYIPSRRLWQCKTRHPRAQFSIKVGTVMEDSSIGLDKWLLAMWMLANCKNGVSSWEMHRTIGVTQKTAWFMLHRLRLALGTSHQERIGHTGGPVEVDETYVGGKLKNMHATKRGKLHEKHGDHIPKAIVFGMLDRETRQVRAKVIPNVERGVLMAEILNGVKHGATVYSDAHPGYLDAHKWFVHDAVNHTVEYVKGQIHTQGIENFWSLLKRGLNGTYVSVEPFHLERYVAEQVFRYNNRATRDNPLNDSDRFALAVTQIVGKRLTYADLTGKDGNARPEPF